MERKHNILSANSLMNLAVKFKRVDQEDEIITVLVKVDYAGDMVYFEDTSRADIDYDDLSAEILAFLRPSSPKAPTIPPEILKKIETLRSGNYTSNIPEGIF